MALNVQAMVIEAVREMGPLVRRIEKFDRGLARQLRNAANSVALNIAEAAGSRAGHVRERMATASGSNRETRMALQLAEVWGYIGAKERQAVDEKLDQVAAILWRLSHR